MQTESVRVVLEQSVRDQVASLMGRYLGEVAVVELRGDPDVCSQCSKPLVQQACPSCWIFFPDPRLVLVINGERRYDRAEVEKVQVVLRRSSLLTTEVLAWRSLRSL